MLLSPSDYLYQDRLQGCWQKHDGVPVHVLQISQILWILQRRRPDEIREVGEENRDVEHQGWNGWVFQLDPILNWERVKKRRFGDRSRVDKQKSETHLGIPLSILTRAFRLWKKSSCPHIAFSVNSATYSNRANSRYLYYYGIYYTKVIYITLYYLLHYLLHYLLKYLLQYLLQDLLYYLLYYINLL